ncbi:MAG: pirin family protein [Acidimicrobiia bacterium]|nr:pirin family protein [Acidimicrobiia bacterium]
MSNGHRGDAGVDVRRATERFHTVIDWLDSWHSFSFGHHWDRANTGHGLLIVNNDDRVAPGAGFPAHGHANMEIVTWVLSGALEHRDTIGSHGIILPGHAQRMSAGSGIRHSEMNASVDEPVHLVQMWVRPDTVGVTPSYEQVDVSDELASGRPVAVASGDPTVDAAVRLHQQTATLWAARLDRGGTMTVPAGSHAHVFVASGRARVGDGEDAVELEVGDAVRLTAAGERPLVAVGDVVLGAGTEAPAGEPGRAGAGGSVAEVLVWVTG